MKKSELIERFAELAGEVHMTALGKGWWDMNPDLAHAITVLDRKGEHQLAQSLTKLAKCNIGEKIALMHSELSEGWGGWWSKAKDDKLPEFSMLEAELADTIIREMDTAVALGMVDGIVSEMRNMPKLFIAGDVATLVSMAHTNLSSVLEAFRHDDKSRAEHYFALVVCLIMDNSNENGWRVGEAILAKMAFNKTRPHKHGGKRF